LVFNLFAVSQGFTLRSKEPSTFGDIVCIVNLPGIVPWYVLGNPLAHPDDPVQYWNDFLALAGGTLGWTFAAFIVGTILDTVRRPTHAR
jgi:hypothetical protein